MEPPAKRLRILKSVEVDENNPEYVRKKREAEAQLKSQFESIFAKYENMPESMSDEIDMVEGRVVVDRGHLRSLQARPHAMRAADFLEDLLIGGPESNGVLNGYDEDDRDELAPPEPPKKRIRRADEGNNDHVALLPPAVPANAPTQAPLSSNIADTVGPSNLTQIPRVQRTPANFMQSPQLPPTPASSLTHLAQLPPTPGNQQVQNNFLAALSQTMAQAVHQAFTIANGLGNASTMNLPSTPFMPSLTAPATADTIAPTSNPKWYFPPLPEKQRSASIAQSSSIPGVEPSRKRRRSLLGPARKGPNQREPVQTTPTATPTLSEATSQAEDVQVNTTSTNEPASVPQAQVQPERTRHNAIYAFSREDDAYITEQIEVNKLPWPDVRSGRQAWKDWPLAAIHNRYEIHLRGRNADVGNSTKNSGEFEEVDAETESPEHGHAKVDLGALAEPVNPHSTPKRRRRVTKYTFSSDDDQYIIEQEARGLSWPEIKQSQTKWRDWPQGALYNRWRNHLRNRKAAVGDTKITREQGGESVLQGAAAIQEDELQKEIEAQTKESLGSPSRQRQLLTPHSLQHAGSSDTHKDSLDTDSKHINVTAHEVEPNDGGDVDLRSIAETPDVQVPASIEVDTTLASSPPPEEVILPSIETNTPMVEDENSHLLCTTNVVKEKIQTPERSATIETKPLLEVEDPRPSHLPTQQPSAQKSKPKPKAIPRFEVSPDSDDGLDLVDAGSSPIYTPPDKPHACSICSKPFKFLKALKAHEMSHPSRIPKTQLPRPSTPTGNPDDDLSDELNSSPGVRIKREPSSPRPTLFGSTPIKTKTPRSVPKTMVRAASKMPRKEYLKIQQSWSKRASPGPKQAQVLRKRASFQSTATRKRAWDADSGEDSEDELAVR